MAKVIDLQAVVKHIVNGSFGDNLCRICLLPLGECYEDVFTKVCREGKEYCIADILHELCQIQIMRSDKYKVCSDCFFEASSAYKFNLLLKRTEEILTFYVDGLNQHIDSIDIPHETSSDSICIKMPTLDPETEIFNYDLSGLCLESNDKQFQDLTSNNSTKTKQKAIAKKIKRETAMTNTVNTENYEAIAGNEMEKIDSEDGDIVIIMSENNEQSFYRINEDSSLVSLDAENAKSYSTELLQGDENQPSSSSSSAPKTVNGKRTRRRAPMDYKNCSQCPVKYRFVTKLKEHMKTDHNIDIFVCKVCKIIIENEDEFNNHLKTHTDIHRCSICNAVFKKRETIIAHLKSHEAMKELSKAKTARVCEICGWILKDEDSLKEHHQDKHVKKYTCYYCGRMYKGEISFDVHIKKHEAHLDSKQRDTLKKESQKKPGKRRFECTTCSKNFVDERSLMWHQRLHNDERPYVCEVCGRAFVSVNRRNQHALCAHTAPARRCPLCPALFHLRSMVNSHIKKVHLQSHKRRHRSSRQRPVFWRTEPVPFSDLSVDVQNDILMLNTQQPRRVDVQTKTEIKQEEDFLDAYCNLKLPLQDYSTQSLVN